MLSLLSVSRGNSQTWSATFTGLQYRRSCPCRPSPHPPPPSSASSPPRCLGIVRTRMILQREIPGAQSLCQAPAGPTQLRCSQRNVSPGNFRVISCSDQRQSRADHCRASSPGTEVVKSSVMDDISLEDVEQFEEKRLAQVRRKVSRVDSLKRFLFSSRLEEKKNKNNSQLENFRRPTFTAIDTGTFSMQSIKLLAAFLCKNG